MPAFGLIILLTKFYYTVLKSRSKKNENIYLSETEKKLVPVGSNVATVFAFVLSFSKLFF